MSRCPSSRAWGRFSVIPNDLVMYIIRVLCSLLFPHLEWAVVLYEFLNGLIPTSYSNNDLVIFNFNEQFLSSVGVSAFRLSHKEETCFTVLLIVIDVISKFTISWVISRWLIKEVYPLEVIHVVVNSF